VEHPDRFKEMLADEGADPEELGEEYLQALRAHIHFSEFQQFEAFLALMVAVFQPLPHWLYLTSYRTPEIHKKAQALLNDDAETFSNGKCTDMLEAIDQAIYLGLRSQDPAIAEGWDTNISNLRWFLRRLAYKYLNSDEYNSYKHGLRIMAGPSYFSFRPSESSEPGITFSSEDSIRYLTTQKLEYRTREVREVYQHFSPIESLNPTVTS